MSNYILIHPFIVALVAACMFFDGVFLILYLKFLVFVFVLFAPLLYKQFTESKGYREFVENRKL